MSTATPANDRSRLLGAVGLAVLAGLVLVGGATGTWLSTDAGRSVGSIRIAEIATVPGVDFSPAAVPIGIAAILGAFLLPATRGRGRRGAGIVLGLLGVGGLGAVIAGVLTAAQQAGPAPGGGVTTVGTAPVFAGIGALALVAAGWMVVRRPAQQTALLDDRYTVEAATGEVDDDEWALSSSDTPQAVPPESPHDEDPA